MLNCLPKSAQPTARRALAEIRDAQDRGHAEVAIGQFRELFDAKYPKAVAKIVDDADLLLAFYDFPAEHWIHLKTTNPIESTFSTVRLRTRVTKGPGSRVPRRHESRSRGHRRHSCPVRIPARNAQRRVPADR